MAKSRLDILFEKIEDLEKQIRKRYPKQKGRVLIANAKQNTDYVVDSEDSLLWARTYQEELQKQL